MLYNFLENLNFRAWIWVIPLMLFLHEMEEWNILKWYHSTNNTPPKSTNLSCRIWLFIMSIWGFAVTALAYCIPNKYISSGIILFLVVFTTFNGLQHIYWLFAFKKYAPGVIFSSLGIIAGVLLSASALIKEITSPIYIIILYTITIPFLIATIHAKNKCIGTFNYLHNLTLKIVKVLEK
ncbi:MAG: HXXEE domain-containing protein [Oscillospiraceae bacterium]